MYETPSSDLNPSLAPHTPTLANHILISNKNKVIDHIKKLMEKVNNKEKRIWKGARLTQVGQRK